MPLAEAIPIGFEAVRTGPRSIDWCADKPATLYRVETHDDGNPKKEVEIRDKVFMLSAPFNGKPTPIVSLGLRYNTMMWSNDNLAIGIFTNMLMINFIKYLESYLLYLISFV